MNTKQLKERLEKINVLDEKPDPEAAHSEQDDLIVAFLAEIVDNKYRNYNRLRQHAELLLKLATDDQRERWYA
jgi:hypothetical protein